MFYHNLLRSLRAHQNTRSTKHYIDPASAASLCSRVRAQAGGAGPERRPHRAGLPRARAGGDRLRARDGQRPRGTAARRPPPNRPP
ncbi:hypothetical protein PR003_g24416 [Phytophthora rubi]|nr:hypothetical protein PR003_g24416 [Phytophthora rubi]